MILERGDMWSVFGKTDLFLITTNPVINRDGLAVMGRGIAKEAADRFPTIRRDFAKQLVVLREMGLGDCQTDTLGYYDGQFMGFFMVKSHWANDADLGIIRQSVVELGDWLFDVPKTRVDLNFPGIGNGRLRREDVLPLLEVLPDNVHIWEYA